MTHDEIRDLLERSRPGTPGPWEAKVPSDDGDDTEFVIAMGEALGGAASYATGHRIDWDPALWPEDGEQFEEVAANWRGMAALPDLHQAATDLLAALDAARAGTLGRQARIAELEAENTDLREGLGRLRAALEGAEEFFERVTGWDGPPNEREKVLDALRAALAPEEGS